MHNSDYDSEPVYYCKDCLSLCIKTIAGLDYCNDCSSMSIGIAKDIYEWKRLYKEKYNK